MAVVMNRKRAVVPPTKVESVARTPVVPNGRVKPQSEVRDEHGVAVTVADIPHAQMVGDEYGDEMMISSKNPTKARKKTDNGTRSGRKEEKDDGNEQLNQPNKDEASRQRKQFAASRLTSSKNLMIEKWVEDAARATSVPSKEELDANDVSVPRAVNGEATHSLWPSKDVRFHWPPRDIHPVRNHSLLSSKSGRKDGAHDEGDYDGTSHATSTRAFATVTAKPSFDTEVSPRSAPSSPAPPFSSWDISQSPQTVLKRDNESKVKNADDTEIFLAPAIPINQPSLALEKAIDSGIFLPQVTPNHETSQDKPATIKRAAIQPSSNAVAPDWPPKNESLKRTDSGSVMTPELTATLERFHSIGGGLHTSFTCRSNSTKAKNITSQKRARPSKQDVSLQLSQSFVVSAWTDFESFMRRGTGALSKKRMGHIERMLVAIKDISNHVQISPPSIPVALSVLADDVEKSTKKETPASNDLFNGKIALLHKHLSKIIAALRSKKTPSAAKATDGSTKPSGISAAKPPRPHKVDAWQPYGPTRRSSLTKIPSENTGEGEEKQRVDHAHVESEARKDESTAIFASYNQSRGKPKMLSKGAEVEEMCNTERQPTLAEGRMSSLKTFKRIRSRDSAATSVYHDFDLEDSNLHSLDLAHQISNPMRVTFISVKSYGNSEPSSRSLNFVPHPRYRRDYSKYRMGSLTSVPSSHAMSLNSSFTRIDFVPQPPYDGPRPSVVEQIAERFYCAEPIYYRWKISRILGRGSFSQLRAGSSFRESFRGQMPSGIVAVKLVQKEADDLFTSDGICKEVASYKRLARYGTTAKLLEITEDAFTVYLVIQHLEGGHLFNRIAYQDFYPNYNERDVAFFIKQLVVALKAAHDEGIIHRDVKPENILFEREFDPKNPRESAKIVLTDYGIAHVGNGSSYDLSGTPLYMAPEVLLKHGHDCKADMWSLGVIAHLMLLGRPPYDDSDVEELTRMIKFEPVNVDDVLWTPISSSAYDFVSKLLKKNPKERMSSTEALQHPWLNDEIMKDHDGPNLEVAQVALQSINARNGLNERNRLGKIMSEQGMIEQEEHEDNLGLFGATDDLDALGSEAESGVVTRKMTAFATGKVGAHVVTQKRQRLRGWAKRMTSSHEETSQSQLAAPQQFAELEQSNVADDEISESTIGVPAQEMSQVLADKSCVAGMKDSMANRRYADAEADGPRKHRRRRSKAIWPGKRKASDEKKKRRLSGLSRLSGYRT